MSEANTKLTINVGVYFKTQEFRKLRNQFQISRGEKINVVLIFDPKCLAKILMVNQLPVFHRKMDGKKI